ncbi:MAG: DNA alkylation repair protein [Sphingobacteriales bacterium]|nr:DNA alkylation repair protein [Sphingobacteriales bacterium]MBI3720763.1 DNA alkylation repair protein [Sphingobacteriales bacterium]
MHPYTKGLITLYKKHGNKEQAEGAAAYMRNQFEFFGLKATDWRNLFKTYTNKNLPSFTDVPLIVEELWSLPQRELQYAAIELLALYKKEWTKEVISLIEFIIVNKSWWETVDHAATELTGPYFKLFSSETKRITGKWNSSDNFWLQRSSIMFQKKYKKDTDTALLSKYILAHKKSKEFFVQKAIGWALREYSYVDAEWVSDFVKQNKLAPLSEREALKRIK